MAQDPPPPSKKTPGPHDRSALLQAFQDVVRDQQDKKTGSPAGERLPSRHTYSLIMLAMAAGLMAILVLKPAWLFPPPIEESTELRNASLRVRMYVEIERVEQFRVANGHLPASLVQAEADTTGLSYSTDGTKYSLTGVNQGVSLTYASGTVPQEFLGNSYALITHRRRP